MQSNLSVALENANAWLDHHVQHLASHDIYPTSRDSGRAVFETEFGQVRLTAENSNLQVRIDSADADGLAVLQNAVSENLIAAAPGLAETMTWQGVAPRPGKPKNFRAMEIIQIRPVCDWLLRMTLKGDNLAPFAERGLHVRLMFRPGASERPIVWPTISKSGSVVYPDGEDALIVRVYTIRNIDVERGKVDIDIVRHAGGAFSDWSETAAPGDLVGMVGPGGGYFPDEGWLGIGGDDTAVPAILRILEARTGDAGGHAVIGLRPGQTPLEVTAPADFQIDWVPLEDLPAAMRGLKAPTGTRHIGWFAGEAEQAREIREFFKTELALDADSRSSSAYWRSNPANHSH